MDKASQSERRLGFNILKKDNRRDKNRFEKLKETQAERGRGAEKATQVAAEEIKEMRRREGRSKEESP